MSNDATYTNADLDMADELLVAAGKPELSVALRYQTQGVRNLVQGEWGQSFVNALEGMLVKHIQPVTESISGLHTEMQRLAGETATRLGKLDKDIKALKRDLSLSKKDRADLRKQLVELQAFRREIEARIAVALPNDEAQALIAFVRKLAKEHGDGQQ